MLCRPCNYAVGLVESARIAAVNAYLEAHR
jgi:hypothetical protein